jgi:hypothetical protein
MVPKLSKWLFELYSSEFNWCLSTSDGKKYTAALIKNTVSGKIVYENMHVLQTSRV